MKEANKRREDVELSAKTAEWKVRIASRLRETTTARNAWDCGEAENGAFLLGHECIPRIFCFMGLISFDPHTSIAVFGFFCFAS